MVNDAEFTGSVNTVFLNNNKTVIGENTDVYGLQAAYLKEIDNSSNKKALVIGAKLSVTQVYNLERLTPLPSGRAEGQGPYSRGGRGSRGAFNRGGGMGMGEGRQGTEAGGRGRSSSPTSLASLSVVARYPPQRQR